MGSKRKWKQAAASRDAGGFVAMPWAVLDSPAYRALSHPGKALLMEFARQYVRDNNGRLLASGRYLAARGWTSNAVITRAKQELLDAGFIHETVKGQRPNKASWYAVTWATLDHIEGFDPGARSTFQRGAYRRNAALLPNKTTPTTKDKKMLNLDTNGYELKPSGGVERLSIAPSGGDHLEEPSTPARREGRGMEGEDAKTAAAQREQHSVDGQIEQGRYVRLMARPKRLFTRLLEGQHQGDDDQGMQLAQAVVQRAAQAAGSAVAP